MAARHAAYTTKTDGQQTRYFPRSRQQFGPVDSQPGIFADAPQMNGRLRSRIASRPTAGGDSGHRRPASSGADLGVTSGTSRFVFRAQHALTLIGSQFDSHGSQRLRRSTEHLQVKDLEKRAAGRIRFQRNAQALQHVGRPLEGQDST